MRNRWLGGGFQETGTALAKAKNGLLSTMRSDREDEKSELLKSCQVVTGCPSVPSSCSTGGDG